MDDALQQAAADLGFEIIPDPDAGLRFGLAKLLGGPHIDRIENVLQRGNGGVRLVVATVRRRLEGNAAIRPVSETILYFAQDGLTLPNMAVQPRRRMSGLQSAVLGLAGFPKVEFPDDGEFDQAYRVLTLQPESAQALFTDELRRYLLSLEDVTVRTEDDRIAVLREGRAVSSESLPEFVDEMNDVVMMLARNAADLPRRNLSPADEQRETLRNLRGVGAAIARRVLVSREEFEQFLQQPPPRDIPASIRGQHLGLGSLFFYIWGGMFLGIGSMVVFGLLAQRAAPPPVIAALCLLPLIGLSAILLTFRYRRRIRRMLTHGECREARVGEVRPTNVYVNNRRRYRITLLSDDGGAEQPIQVHAYEPAVQKAMGLSESGERTRVLVDPADPRRAIWIDAFTG